MVLVLVEISYLFPKSYTRTYKLNDFYEKIKLYYESKMIKKKASKIAELFVPD